MPIISRILALVVGLATLGLPLFASAEEAQYTGRSSCQECHAGQVAAWQGSHHDLAMQAATPATVLGDFDAAELEVFGVTSRFFRADGQFMVRTDGPDGRLTDFPIQYTFGAYPLQQYLIEFPGGRLQALDIAWDARPEDQGGQRWFNLHPQDPVRHDDVLHWSGPNLNWNYMCAGCHSTNLKKNYDADSDSYDTTWSEIDVSCEACHGPGSRHLEWAKAWQRGDQTGHRDKGLTVLFDERDGVEWRRDEASGELRRSTPRSTSREIQVCARCHARRGQLTDADTPGQPFLDAFRPALLTRGLYYADGQIQDEVYVWGSFLQSRMYQAGVTCSDCHDPHAAKLKAPGDKVCYQCHEAQQYAAEDHHFHDPDSAGSRCVACHMPPRNFMIIDERHDHSIRVPRPDLSVSLQVPNACNNCHTDESAQWAATAVEQWYGRQPVGLQDYAAALHAARNGLPGARSALQSLANDSSAPSIARATALTELASYPDQRNLALIQQGLNSDQPLERLGSLDALAALAPGRRVIAFPLLWDDIRAVRIEAARLLAAFPADRLPEASREKLAQVIEEYISVQQFSAERPESQLNLAGVYTERGRLVEAEAAYRRALKLQPQFIPAYVNYAQFMATMSRRKEVENLLRSGLQRNPENADLEHALGLNLIRQQQTDAGLAYIARAAAHAPDVARYRFVHAIALHSSGRVDEALEVLDAAHHRHPGDVDILYALATINRDAGRPSAAATYAARLLELQPGNPAAQQILDELRDESSRR